MSSDLATRGGVSATDRFRHLATISALVAAGFRRYATYRQATVAAAVTNSVFGFLRSYVLLAAVAGAAGGVAAGYQGGQLLTYAWVSQGMIGIVGLWGWSDLGDRIRSGEVVADLLRPVHPVTSYLAIDLGRAGYGALTRFVIPVLTGALCFDLYAPGRLVTYPLFVVSIALSVLVSFGCRYLVNAAGFWLLDVRGVTMLWLIASVALTGLSFPLHFLPSWLLFACWTATPFPSIMQAPLDVLVERGSTTAALGLIVGQAVWAGVLLGLCRHVQRRAERRLVIQGG